MAQHFRFAYFASGPSSAARNAAGCEEEPEIRTRDVAEVSAAVTPICCEQYREAHEGTAAGVTAEFAALRAEFETRKRRQPQRGARSPGEMGRERTARAV